LRPMDWPFSILAFPNKVLRRRHVAIGKFRVGSEAPLKPFPATDPQPVSLLDSSFQKFMLFLFLGGRPTKFPLSQQRVPSQMVSWSPSWCFYRTSRCSPIFWPPNYCFVYPQFPFHFSEPNPPPPPPPSPFSLSSILQSPEPLSSFHFFCLFFFFPLRFFLSSWTFPRQ